jgi:hydrogenase maturation protease
MNTLVLGIGNRLMTDEGIGPRLADRLAAHPSLPPGVTVEDGGSGGLAVLHALPGYDCVFFVDCAVMGETAGTLRTFAPEDVHSVKRLAGASLHEGDLLQTIALARRLGECPGIVRIVGIEPAVVAPGETLSPALAARVDDYTTRILSELCAVLAL